MKQTVDLLIIEENLEICLLLHDAFRGEKYAVHLTNTGEDALTYLEQYGAKLVLIDLPLNNTNGLLLCKNIMDFSKIPIVVLTDADYLSHVSEKELLQAGACVCLQKPFDMETIIETVKEMFSRFYVGNILVSDDLELDYEKKCVLKGKKELKLTTKEFELLFLLMENRGKTLSKQFLFDSIWGEASQSSYQTLTVHMKWLREKLEENPKHPVHILTDWGIGYRFE